VQGLLANPGFEEPLDPTTDWTLVASGGGDGRVQAATPNGRFALVLQANGALETLSQTVALAGGSGETYVLTLAGLGAGLTAGETMDATLRSTMAGAALDTATCTFSFPSPDFSASPAPCELTTTGTYDAVDVILAWNGATTGTLTLDALSLIRR
jgi:hypothetical protein